MDAIIDLLQKNALMPRDEMAKLLNMTTAEVEATIAKMEADGIILGYQPIINREKWETDNVTAVIEVKITPERDGGFDRIASRIARFAEVQGCYLVSGGFDLLIVVESPNLRAAASFVAERLST
ncbi:MAG: Lrp/AsnC family transcriptional regulator, partial [Deltaproteobacteria bacterium]